MSSGFVRIDYHCPQRRLCNCYVAFHTKEYAHKIDLFAAGTHTSEVVIGRGPTAVKNFMRLRLQKFVPTVRPQPLVRVMARVTTTKHQHKPNQQKITTQIKQPKIN